ncbi:MAG: YlxR family protein [Tessaracoccus sp.]
MKTEPADRSEPQRTCIACRRRDEQSALIRMVRRGDVVVNATAPRLPGRGAYVHAGCIGLLEPRKAIRRTFGAAAVLDPDFASRNAG